MNDTALSYYETLVLKAKDYIEHNFQNAISLAGIADHCNVSPFHFSRLFKSTVGVSPYQYILQTRLMYAESLLRTTRKSIMDVSFSSGFNSIEHFSTTFKAKYKKNPRTYRQQFSRTKPDVQVLAVGRSANVTDYLPRRVRICLSDPLSNKLFSLIVNGFPGYKAIETDVWHKTHRSSAFSGADFIITDLRSCGSDPVGTIRRYMTMEPDCKILMVCTCKDPDTITRLLTAGVVGFISKSEGTPQAILQALDDIKKGGAPLSSDVSKILVEKIQSGVSHGC